MRKLEFDIVEIPEGESRRTEILEPEDLDLSPYEFTGGQLALEFNRMLRLIRVNYQVQGGVELVCDRSLEIFEHMADTNYDVIFKTDVKQETEDENGAVRRFNFSSNSFSIEKEVRDSIMLTVPMQKIHPEYRDEQGNYNDFETKSFGKPLEIEEEPIDPRWEKLKEL